MSPTARSLREARRLGLLPAVVERFIRGANVRQDLYGMIDVLCILGRERLERGEFPAVLGIQACTAGDAANRVAKLQAHPNLGVWSAHGFALEVWAWGLRGARDRRKVWTLDRRRVSGKGTGR